MNHEWLVFYKARQGGGLGIGNNALVNSALISFAFVVDAYLNISRIFIERCTFILGSIHTKTQAID